MKVVILAGGFGTRISEESVNKPKPMIEIGGRPILWHIMKIYSSFGFNEFVVCAGYKQNYIKEYFANYFIYRSDVTFDFAKENEMTVHSHTAEPWKVTIVDTGLNTLTGGRVKRVKDYIGDEPFFLTYGDGVSDVNIQNVLDCHNRSGMMCTITAIRPEGRFGVMDIAPDGQINAFRQKSKDDSGWINGGFMVIEPDFLDYIEGDSTVLEEEPFEAVLAQNKMNSYKHDGFWMCMDNVRDRQKLEEYWATGDAPWKLW